MVKAHFQIRTLIDIKNIYTAIVMIYHTTLTTVVCKAGKPCPLLFESVHIFLTYIFVREQYGTENSSRPHIRALTNIKFAHNHNLIYHFKHHTI